MILHVTAGGPPPGMYEATLNAIEPTQYEEYGAGLRWTFVIQLGPCQGQRANRTTGTTPTAKNGCGKMLAGLLGRELRPNEEVDLREFIGRTFSIVVAATENGGTRVEAVAPINRS